ncbi:hypothetical protein GCM10008018_01790 [Paenibacillus marchantiophytorum]|uniref:DUF3243 domain-containing protein n=1 Tax=Paenibacillus marchantiophytorum TaxID=1619310 RepID=A0ABQ2BQ49_9BACL|nr:hypothetical protein [Paenibacillus marchantiophytorum]GGI43382.1 hypothetical protein GCM10008018_01790 [Paenibacillus marchantiophytorum]
MNLQDTFFNWLQMHIVHEARPDDEAAKETLDFFALILREDHGVRQIQFINEEDRRKIHIAFEREGASHTQSFEREAAEKLLDDINSNPIYNNQ